MPIDRYERESMTAREWLRRQHQGHDTPFNGEGPIDGEECLICGASAREGHEPTDPCGIVANLLAGLDGLRADLARLRESATAFVQHYRKNGGCSHCGGIPHTTTCYVGRIEVALAPDN